MTSSEIPHQSFSHAHATYIIQVNNADLAAMAARMDTTPDRVIEIALGKLYLSLLEGEPSPGSGFFWETRIGTDEMFRAAQKPAPAPSVPQKNLLDLLRDENTAWDA